MSVSDTTYMYIKVDHTTYMYIKVDHTIYMYIKVDHTIYMCRCSSYSICMYISTDTVCNQMLIIPANYTYTE